MRFSGQVYIYLENDLENKEAAEIEGSFSEKGYNVIFRGSAYRVIHWNEFNRLEHNFPPTPPGIVLPAATTGTAVEIINGLGSETSANPPSQSEPARPTIGNDNTLVGRVDPMRSMGSGNTIVGATDANGNVMLNTPMAIGRDAHAGPGSVAIGAGANAGGSDNAEIQRRRHLIDGYIADWRRSNDGHPPEQRDLIDKAAPYIAERLSEDGESWSFTAEVRAALGYPKSRVVSAKGSPAKGPAAQSPSTQLPPSPAGK
ncbi:MAG TPA: hypothetical protein VH722_02135, partial [Alphaproteobacteria bacterium]|nr:hypothetical protein [Alphaproteobacteria bacterium]